MEPYDHRAIEKKWQDRWEKAGIYATGDNGRDTLYTLVEFPYPSGNLHVGHWYAFAVPDIFARAKKMQGNTVLFPIGFDAFGLPAENAAIKRNLNPRHWTNENISYMEGQLRTMGASFDWSRKVVTSEPDYYRWTQWLMLQLFKNNLAYQAETSVNWCPSCKTVLANEQVIGGHCERCDSEVAQKKMKQWMLKITDYGERLLEDLEDLPWPHAIKESQRNWIGKSVGTHISFPVDETDIQIRVFTTHPDTLFGATYMVLAPEHDLVEQLLSKIENKSEVVAYIKKSQGKTELERTQGTREKTGVVLQGIQAVNPATKERIPICIADYVLAHVGTGAIMAVPAHDERDFAFADAFKLPIVPVVIEEGRRAIIVHGTSWADRSDNDPKIPDNERHWLGWLTKKLNENGIETVAPLMPDSTKPDYEKWKEVFEKYLVDEKTTLVGHSAGAAFIIQWLTETGTTIDRLILAAPGSMFREGTLEERRASTEKPSIDTRVKNQVRNGIVCLVSDDEHESIQDAVTLYEKELNAQVVRLSGKGHLMYRDMGTDEFPELMNVVLGHTTYTGEGVLVNSGHYTGISTLEARETIPASVGGKMTTTYRMRDWVISRQRYWGCPIPIIHCTTCGAVPVPEEDLPVVLPEVQDFLPTGDGKSPLAKVRTWMEVPCPSCGGKGERETDTLDTFIDSSWYFLRYIDPNNDQEFAAPEKLKQWMPVNMYSGGAEHTTMHLLYSRFFHKALFDLGLVYESEPYERRLNRGIILGPDGAKMSKSKGNVIDPDEYVERLGADTVRLYLAFIGPYNEVGHYPWNPESIAGVRRFVEKVWRLKEKVAVNVSTMDGELETLQHQTVKKVTDDIENFKFNTAVSQLMIFVSNLEKKSEISQDTYELLVRLLAPFAPHVSEELWYSLGHDTSVHTATWPSFDPDKLTSAVVTIAVQIDGKTRGTITVPAGSSEAHAVNEVKKHDGISRFLGEGYPLRIIFVEDRLINFVTSID